MLRKGKLIPLACCLALLGLTACSDDDATCGDGVAQKKELCDLEDLKGNTCNDVIPGSSGTLACSATCTFNTDGCELCGDGVNSFTEQCDCGTNPNTLPAGCTAINGAAGANCSETCQRVAVCGDGRKDSPEGCDCGIDPENLPTGCPAINGGTNHNCTELCEPIIPCNVTEQFGECDPFVANDCCPDSAGVEIMCLQSLYQGMDNMCNRECTDAGDCWWNMTCIAYGYDQCIYAFCGPEDLVPAEFMGACQPAGGSPGICVPFGRYSDTRDPFGICMESGDIAHGDPCPADADLFMTDREYDGGAAAKMCDQGLCYAAQGDPVGTCYQVCDWQKAYAVAFYGAAPGTEPLPCPTGSGCFAESTIDPATGYRSGDYAACRLTEDLTACSLVTGTLITNPALSCADAGFADGRCVLVDFGTSGTTWGSLIGACMAGTAAPNLAVWALCDPDNTNEICPVGSVCERPDVFGTDTMATRCVPMCDTAHADGTQGHCADLGAVPTGDGTPLCRSVSNLFPPNGPTDTMKSRLGFCGF